MDSKLFTGKCDLFRSMIEEELERLLPIIPGPQAYLLEAMRYSLLEGGKRVRGLYFLMTAEMLGLSPKQSLPYAGALEMIHAYSLIHDDLPAMDDDNMRRGKASNHRVYGEGQAILAGDALLNTAMEILISQCFFGRYACETSLYIAECAGKNGMIVGQSVDLQCTQNVKGSITTDELEFLQDKKTASLLRASIAGPALLAGSSAEIRHALEQLGTATGMIYQIVDDLLDEHANPQQLGKSIGKDKRDGKMTALSVMGRDNAIQKVKQWMHLADSSFSILRKSRFDCSNLELIFEALLHRKK